ncbi:unnamed protein product [Thelazia callipaeda]|uniref:C2 domain-containing protein n=1 Tax=Thelazia callipaeda TaxID=103827 RepID=A0A0N5D5I9_THECL|nr:unnamed protein product [Thelazia callipaeda]
MFLHLKYIIISSETGAHLLIQIILSNIQINLFLRKRVINFYAILDDFQNMDAWRILNDITFIRLNLEYIYMNEEDEFIEEVIRQRSLFGFILEYNFPSVDAAPASLKTRVRVHAKHFSGNTIHFQHKRVLRIKMVPELVNLWKRAQLLLTVYAKLNTLGKYSVKKMGTCQVPLHDLTIPPFIICRDFLFLGAGFSGSALIKIDLGSHVRQLMERLEWMRHDTLPQIGSATRARSRSCKKELAPTSCQLTPVIPQRRAFSSSPPPRFSKITNRVKIVLVSKPVSPLNLTYSSASNSLVPSPGVLNDPHIPIQGLCPTSPSYRIRLTVYSARRLPFDFNSRKEAVVPATYLTVTGEDGRTLSSPIRTGTLHPEWNWTETFNVCLLLI